MSNSALLRKLPAVHEAVKAISHEWDGSSEKEITRAVKDSISFCRTLILRGMSAIDENTDFLQIIKQRVIKELENPSNRIRSVINASGVVIHTNLGRSRLSEAAVNRMMETALAYSNLEYNLEEGKRGSRHDLTEHLIKQVTGAEAAMVVNNNAAAVYLILKAFAKNKEVIVSRGELVEIGGSFRISSIMEESGATLKEVGTTNKTHLSDYEKALNENTSIVMKVHTSNFKVIGFTKEVPSHELLKLKNEISDVILYEDLGSGALFPFQHYGIGEEPLVSKVIEQGIDLVSFSGDKLLGGPQAGIIAGKKEYIDILKKHQLARVLRVDKFTIAALNETFHAYLNDEILSIPTVRDILKSESLIKERVSWIKNEVGEHLSLNIEVVAEFSQVGGGTMPDVKLPTYCLSLKHVKGAEYLSKQLKEFRIPIIVRIKDDSVLMDLRTITIKEESLLLEAIRLIN
ncbi:L-seryl-tRNA(Sec) selenium transferase [Bacillus sp. NEB1478]|uniref:L-seryl-tRNA(Sec) selenium transferase n=1 Tax=Bacillus sp. NEB1478 TaxID=3073816 RepID=UPI002872C0A4|nr:L-seryl-tRNA(Sec) selenium transferase [Bacillus sp. NEB1478]WNB90274.1 L-seryl-tRNA(Sec) selenium transferase [Bacillus sp. NEB1478]